MEYVITKIKGTYDSQYPDSKKYVFNVEGYAHDISTFSKFPMKEGDTINGDITVNGQWHNFKFGKKNAPTQDNSVLIREVQAVNTNVLRVVGHLSDLRKELIRAGVIKETNSDGSPVPDFSGSGIKSYANGTGNSTYTISNSSADEVDVEDLPF